MADVEGDLTRRPVSQDDDRLAERVSDSELVEDVRIVARGDGDDHTSFVEQLPDVIDDLRFDAAVGPLRLQRTSGLDARRDRGAIEPLQPRVGVGHQNGAGRARDPKLTLLPDGKRDVGSGSQAASVRIDLTQAITVPGRSTTTPTTADTHAHDCLNHGQT